MNTLKTSATAFDVDPFKKSRNILGFKILVEGDLVFLFDLVTRMGELLRKGPIVRE